MSADYRGVRFVSWIEDQFDPETGDERVIHERGIPDDIYARANSWAANGRNVSVVRSGPYADAVIRNIRGANGALYVERWGLRTESIVKSIWSKPEVMAEMEAFGPGKAEYRKGIEDAVDSGDALGGHYLGPEAPLVLRELRRGVEGTEHEYLVMSRTINFELNFPPAPMQLKSVSIIYPTASLVALENIPADILFQLPADGSSPPVQTMWGWRIREQEAEITDTYIGSHQTTWVYALWSTFLYVPYAP